MPIESTYPRVEIPEVDIWTLLFERKDKAFPDDKGRVQLPLLIFESWSGLLQNIFADIITFLAIYTDAETSRSYTYAQVRDTAIEFGKGLKAVWEWQKGDVLALYTPNCIDTPAVLWGTHWAGGIVSPANPGYTVDELTFQLKDSGAKALVTQKPFLKSAQEACRNVGIPDDRIILVGDERDETSKFKHFTNVRNISGATRYRRTKMKPKDLAFLVYSSGTTGHPKGVMLSHGNIVANTLMLDPAEKSLSWEGGKDGRGDKVLAVLPFFHIYVRCVFPISDQS
jgi:4-coumarate--CoA ligase